MGRVSRCLKQKVTKRTIILAKETYFIDKRDLSYYAWWRRLSGCIIGELV